MDSPWYRPENALVDASAPIPSSCVPDIHFFEWRFVEADIGFFASMPTIIQLAIAKQACEFPAAHTVVHFVPLLPSWGRSENARWTLPGIDQRMLDGRQWPHSLVPCSRYTLFGIACLYLLIDGYLNML